MKSRKKLENSLKNSENKKQENNRHRTLLILAGVVFVALIVAATTLPNGSGSITTTTTIIAQPTTTTIKSVSDESSSPNDSVKVEVYHFHRTSQCWSCKTLGALAEKTVNTYFKAESDSGRLKFGHINVELTVFSANAPSVLHDQH